MKVICKELRPYAVSMIESNGVPDEFIISAVGNKYGDIYEQHFEWA